MAVRIRLKRMGAKKRPYYRLVVADARAARDGRFIETLGTYDPVVDPVKVEVDVERAKGWLSKGAQPSDTVRRLLRQAGVDLRDGKAPTGDGDVGSTAAPEVEAAAPVEEAAE